MAKNHNLHQIATALMSGSKKPMKKNGPHGYVVCCPGHNDRTPSLSLTETDEGRIVAYCFGGCAGASLYKAIENHLGYELNELVRDEPAKAKKRLAPNSNIDDKNDIIKMFPVPAHAPPIATATQTKQFGKPVNTWEYRNTKGDLLGYVCRYQSEDGKIIWPWVYGVREGRERWFVGHIPEPRPLYKAHLIAQAPLSTPIIITEGEKAADAAQLIFPEWISTTTIGGGQASHQTDLSILAGRPVVIAPDHDQQGFHYAGDLATQLKEIGAKRIRILRFPHGYNLDFGELSIGKYDIQEGDDLADHFERGWAREHLQSIMRRGGVMLFDYDEEW